MEKELKALGLNDKEIKIYLELLKLGTSKVNDVAKRLGLPRTTVYHVLDSLIAKGLVSYVTKAGVKYFETADPKKLVFIEEEKLAGLKSIVPDLEKIKETVGKKPKVELYEGREGLKTILEDILKTKSKEILCLTSPKIFQIFTFYFPKWIKRRIKKGSFAKILAEKIKIMEEYQKKDKEELREIRFLPKKFKINTEIQIYENKVAILTLRKEELIGVLIENKDIAETQRSLFNSMWEMAEK